MANNAIKTETALPIFSKYAVTCPGQGLYRNGVLELVKTQKLLFQHYLDELDAAMNENFQTSCLLITLKQKLSSG